FGANAGWRLAFLVAGAPGLALAALVWRIREHPGAAGAAGDTAASVAVAQVGVDWRQRVRGGAAALMASARQALSIRTVRYAIALQALVYIAVTPTVTFLPIYLRSRHAPFHVTDAQASLLAGLLLVLGGVVGTLLGGPLADWLGRKVRGGRLLAIGVGFGLGVPGYVTILLTHSLVVFIVVGTLTVLALNLQVGPLGAVLQDATPPHVRASVVAFAMMVAHLLSDTWSPATVGAISTHFGERTATGLLAVAVPTMLLAVVVAVIGRRAYAEDVERRAREGAGE
ncbi:MAG TPA: MFS transporter, partial [Ktedonobacterales bacterium]|nr:MFS transporter [Ktedonobacterales bacterium]